MKVDIVTTTQENFWVPRRCHFGEIEISAEMSKISEKIQKKFFSKFFFL